MRGKKARAQKRDDQIKGTLIEQIVAAMHDQPGVRVQRNVHLPSTQNPKRHREIDVLMTANVIGYEVRFAFECKNYERRADVAKIGEFVDKLNDVGIACQNGIFVSASGFTEGALDRAKQLGMKVLVVSGLAGDRLESMVIEALQSVVYLLPVVTEWTIINDAPHVEAGDLWVWFNEEGEAQATTPDLLWHRWRDGEPASKMGSYEVVVEAPGWAQRVAGKATIPHELRFTVQVIGFVMTFSGRATDHSLTDALTHRMKRRQVAVKFNVEADEQAELQRFESEETFASFLESRREGVKVINRVRLPRLQWHGLFWPLSERVANELNMMTRELKAGETIKAEDLARLEGHLGSVFEPPAAIPNKPIHRR